MFTLLIHPPFDGVPSGGHTYNRCLIEQAQTTGYPLRSVPLSIDRYINSESQRIRVAPNDWVLIDSLLAFAAARLPDLPQSAKLGLLLHYLPSANPLLDESSRSESRRREDQVIAAMRSVIATGRSMQALLQQRYPDTPIQLCEPGVSPVFKPPGANDRRPSHTINLITVANYIPAKGYETLLQILANLKDRNWQWYWVGEDITDPPHSEFLLSTAQRLGIAQRIHRPPVPNQTALADLIKNMDIFVAASQFESYGMALAEAIASGLAVVTTQVGEAARLVDQGGNGFVVPLGQNTAFAECVRQLIGDSSRLAEFKANARVSRIRTWSQTLEDFVSVCGIETGSRIVECG